MSPPTYASSGSLNRLHSTFYHGWRLCRTTISTTFALYVISPYTIYLRIINSFLMADFLVAFFIFPLLIVSFSIHTIALFLLTSFLFSKLPFLQLFIACRIKHAGSAYRANNFPFLSFEHFFLFILCSHSCMVVGDLLLF